MAELSDRKLPQYQFIDGCRYSKGFSPAMVRSAISYNAKPYDLFIITYPKCGTTWMQQVVYLIFHKGQPPATALDYARSNPFLEFTGAQSAEEVVRPAALKLHQPFGTTPYNPQAKYIYVARNPKDCCVSYYYHTKMLPEYEFQDGKFEDFFELFIRDEIEFGGYFENLLSWYQHRNDPNVFFTTYEKMKSDIRSVVKELCQFLGKEYEKMLEDDPTILEKIYYYSSYNFMKDSVNKFVEELFSDTAEEILANPDAPSGLKAVAQDPEAKSCFNKIENVEFVRKGIVGDWRNHLTDEQNKRMNAWIAKNTKNSDVMDLWKDVDCI